MYKEKESYDASMKIKKDKIGEGEKIVELINKKKVPSDRHWFKKMTNKQHKA